MRLLYDELKMGDVLEWVWEDRGVAVAGGQGIVLKGGEELVEKTAYDIRAVNIEALCGRVDRIKVITNIFKDRDFKLSVDKRMVMKDGEPVIANGVVKYE